MHTIVAAVGYVLLDIIFLLILIKERKKNKIIEPLDDSGWNKDLNTIQSLLYKFVSNKQENILAVLGTNHIDNVLTSGKGEGFCILTNKAFYFIGKVLRKTSFFPKKDNVQHRINVKDLRGINVRKITNNIFNVFIIIAASLIVVSVTNGVNLFLGLINCGMYEEVYYGIGLGINAAALLFAVAELIYCFAAKNITKRFVVELEFSNEKYMFTVNQLGKQEIKTFYKAIGSVQQNED